MSSVHFTQAVHSQHSMGHTKQWLSALPLEFTEGSALKVISSVHIALLQGCNPYRSSLDFWSSSLLLLKARNVLMTVHVFRDIQLPIPGLSLM